MPISAGDVVAVTKEALGFKFEDFAPAELVRRGRPNEFHVLEAGPWRDSDGEQPACTLRECCGKLIVPKRLVCRTCGFAWPVRMGEAVCPKCGPDGEGLDVEGPPRCMAHPQKFFTVVGNFKPKDDEPASDIMDRIRDSAPTGETALHTPWGKLVHAGFYKDGSRGDPSLFLQFGENKPFWTSGVIADLGMDILRSFKIVK